MKVVSRRASILAFSAALLLYLPGIWWGLPHATAADRFHPWGSDELAPWGPVFELYNTLAGREAFFNPQYPLFHNAVQGAFAGPYAIYLRASGRSMAPPATEPARVLTLLARLASLLMAAGVVVVAGRTAAVLWGRREAALASALVLVLYPMFYYSRTSNVDMGAMFWTSLGLEVFARCLRQGVTARRAAWFGVWAALATASKDAAYASFLLLPLALVRRAGWRALASGAATAVAVYLIASGLVFHPARYRAHVEYIVQGSERHRGIFYYSTPATASGYISLAGQAGGHLVDAVGLPMALCAAAGLALCCKRDRAALALALPILGVGIGVLAPVRFVLFRFVFVMAYVLALYAARALASGPRAIPLAILGCGWALLRGGDLTYQMIGDSRYAASAWLRLHARPGDRVGYYGSPFKLPHLEPGVATVRMPAPEQPQFIVSMPIQHYEGEHERELADETWRRLHDGTLGYRLALQVHTRSLFRRRPVSFVNPPVTVFVR